MNESFEIRRQKMLKIADGNPGVPPILFHFDKLTLCDPVLDWCIKNRVIGDRLLTMFNETESMLSLCRDIIRRIEKENKVRPIIGGVDYR